MQRLNLQSLRFLLPALLLGYCAIVGAAIYVIVDSTQQRRFEQQFMNDEIARSTELQSRTERAAERGELETSQREFGELAADEPLRAAVFVSPNMQVLLASRREWLNHKLDLVTLGVPPADRPAIEAAMEQTRSTRAARGLFTANGDKLMLVRSAALPVSPGALTVDRSALIVLVYDLSLSKAIATFRLRQLFLWIAGAVMLGSVTLGVALHFFVTRRLERIQRLIGRFAAGESIDDASTRAHDEIGNIGATFNEMARTVRREMAERLDATAALRASEDKFRTAMRYSPIGQALIAANGQLLEVNPAFCQILGYTEDELLKLSFRDLTHPDDLTESVDLNRDVLEGSLGSFQVEKRYIHKAGHTVWAQLNTAAVRRGDDTQYFVSQVQDITERRLAEERLKRANRAWRAISHCNQALVHATNEPSLLKEVCRVIVDDGGYRLAWVAFARAQGVVAAAQWGADDGYIAGSLKMWEQQVNEPGALREFLRSGQTRVTRDFATDPFVEGWRDQALSRGLRSSAIFALKEDGRAFGALMIYSDQPNAFDDHELALLREMSDDLAYGIQALRTRTRQKAAERDLRESQTRLVIAMDMARLAPWEYDVATGEYIFNDTFYALLGTTAEAEGGMRMSADQYAQRFLPPEESGMVQSEIERSLATPDPHFTNQIEHRFLRSDGSIGHMQVRKAIVKDSDGRTVRTYGVNQDITERKLAEDAIRSANQRYERHEAALATLTRCHVHSAEQFPDVLRSITEIVASTLEVSRTAVMRRTGSASFEYADLFEWPANRHSEGVKLSGDAIAEFTRLMERAEIIASHDAAADPRTVEFARHLAQFSIRSFLAVPIRGQGGLAAVLMCSQTHMPRRWMPDEQTFMVAVANLLSSIFAQTDRLHLEAQLRQATKLEGIGQLAGGVAHDFNNVLTVILGKAGQLASDARLPDDLRDAAADITQSGERAANLTRQLLAFSRRQAMQVRDVDLNAVIRNVGRMLERILGEDLTLEVSLEPQPLYIRADAGMIDQVVLNLAVNARDAMRGGGKLTVRTMAVDLDAQALSQHGSRSPGPYACLRVSDTGTGIAAHHLPHIFEPFFTTKDVGKGTGLGLATTYGIVQQHHGWIEVQSEAGLGATFSIYLPSFLQPDVDLSPASPEPIRLAAPAAPPPGRESILVVEDEAEVRSLIVDALIGFGYHVLEARSGPVALELWRDHGAAIDLLITDMVMPGGMNGLDLASRLRDEHPGLRIIYISGYLADVSREDLSQAEGTAYLAKPFNLPTLARLVRQSLDIPQVRP